MAAPMSRGASRISLIFRRLLHSSVPSRSQEFDTKMLEILVCLLSKKALRYDPEKNELVSDELGVAYPIVNGIPNLIPEDARIVKEPEEPQDNGTEETKGQ
ncbi:PYURF [Branchiostoma lanceolatum]|uniref:Protein preY, mitochondrial n=1 Tax=Branchiostoma lanceolatum TaxID=7740 RepID=A0A8K0F0C8_BRALA|nr:PYURF [Branchiostoma lanceolatum]